MITDNIFLETDLKRQLKHMSIDSGVHVSTMLIEEAERVINVDYPIKELYKNSDYDTFTMKVDPDFKEKVRQFCEERDLSFKKFWNTVALNVVNGVSYYEYD